MNSGVTYHRFDMVRSPVLHRAHRHPSHLGLAPVMWTGRSRYEADVNDERWRLAEEAARLGTWEWEPLSDRLFWSEGAERLHGLEPGTFSGDYEAALATVHPDDLESAQVASRRLLAQGAIEAEYRVILPDGSIRWLMMAGKVIDFVPGRPSRAVGVYMDVTRRKHAVGSLQLLADVGVQAGRSLETESTLHGLARVVVPAFADWCTVSVLGEGGAITRVASVHRDPAIAAILEQIDEYRPSSVDGDETVARVIRTGEPWLMPMLTDAMLEQRARDSRHLALLRELRVGSGICVPMLARGRTIGAITFTAELGGRVYGREDLHIAEEIARRAALAADNARLYAEVQQREAKLEHWNDSLQFLADTGIELSRLLDPQETLSRIAELAVPRFADICVVDIVRRPGQVVRVAAAASDPMLTKALGQVSAHGRIRARRKGAPDSVVQKIAAGQSLFFQCVTPEGLAAFARGPEHLRTLQAIHPTSTIIVPMTARGKVLGVITFALNREGSYYTKDDLAVAEQLGRRAGISLENARLYAEAQERESEMVRANDAKDEFLGMMSHELRTPITVIHGGARVLRGRGEQLGQETRVALLSDIERESERLARMLENLLAMARVEFDQAPSLEPMLVQHVVERIIANYRQGAAGRQILFDPEPHLPVVAAEPAYLEHVVRNLVSNAEKYSPPGTSVEVRLEREGEHAVALRVRDRGFGIGAEEAERIFERFYRSNRTAKLAGGAGMGLAVCKRLVEAMSGQIWARPREGGGLEVGFSLPLYEETVL